MIFLTWDSSALFLASQKNFFHLVRYTILVHVKVIGGNIFLLAGPSQDVFLTFVIPNVVPCLFSTYFCLS